MCFDLFAPKDPALLPLHITKHSSIHLPERVAQEQSREWEKEGAAISWFFISHFVIFLLYTFSLLVSAGFLYDICVNASFGTYRKKGREEYTEKREWKWKGFSYLIEDKNNYRAWYCYLHSEYKPIIAIKFAIKNRIKIWNFVINTQCFRRNVFIVEIVHYFQHTNREKYFY